jgi:flagellar protein FlaG
MKVEFTRPISLAPSQLGENADKVRVTAREMQSVSSEKEKKTALAVREVDDPPVTINNFNVRLRFEVDRETGESVVQIIDSESGKLLRQVPPEELLHVMKTLRDLKGLLFSTMS